MKMRLEIYPINEKGCGSLIGAPSAGSAGGSHVDITAGSWLLGCCPFCRGGGAGFRTLTSLILFFTPPCLRRQLPAFEHRRSRPSPCAAGNSDRHVTLRHGRGGTQKMNPYAPGKRTATPVSPTWSFLSSIDTRQSRLCKHSPRICMQLPDRPMLGGSYKDGRKRGFSHASPQATLSLVRLRTCRSPLQNEPSEILHVKT